MSDHVQLSLSGLLLPGYQHATAVAALAQLLKVSEEKAQAMLAGQPTVIKKALPIAALPRYQQVLGEIGVEVLHAPVVQAPATAPLSLAPVAPLAPEPSHAPAASPVAAAPVPEVETITCPSCQFVQPKRTLCRECGADMPRMMAAAREPKPTARDNADGNPYRRQPGRTEEQQEETHTPAFFSFSFEGRLNRLRYIAYSTAFLFPLVLAAILGAVALGWVAIAAMVVLMLVFSLRYMALRLHDIGLSGKWLLLFPLSGMMLITGSPKAAMVVYAIIVLGSLALWVVPGNADTNDYGAPNEPNGPWVIAGAAVAILLTISSGVSSYTSSPFKTGVTPATTEESADEVTTDSTDSQEELARKMVDAAAEQNNLELSEADREAAVQEVLTRMRNAEEEAEE
ncbi:DUF805 domain-containing protein [Chitinimonas viridis]|uniref:DUF805 domain-containing protein n=1 Tax=Chitinimonas viridis TaxID=664880 RepID=A0ABT8B1N2_9NEIS|nr:DUF805 domain-containing protein [Chitinimonas viridis]MDN3575630.1 DUF805 domain-containing protein [Chitinimonas viridis]